METAVFKPTQFRVWMIVSPPGPPAYVEVTTLRDVCTVFDTLVAIRQNLEERDLPVWFDDVSGLEVKGREDWEDFYDTDGEDIEHYYSLWSDSGEIIDPSVFDLKLEGIVGDY